MSYFNAALDGNSRLIKKLEFLERILYCLLCIIMYCSVCSFSASAWSPTLSTCFLTVLPYWPDWQPLLFQSGEIMMLSLMGKTLKYFSWATRYTEKCTALMLWVFTSEFPCVIWALVVLLRPLIILMHLPQGYLKLPGLHASTLKVYRERKRMGEVCNYIIITKIKEIIS